MNVALTKKKKEHYVDNKKFLEEMKKYHKKVQSARKRNRKDPPITNYIGECFLKIANHLSYRPNFINYTYKEDMISDGIENCLQYVANFDPEKSNNPFAYFTQIIYYAFIRRIQKEKKQTTIKQKLIMKGGLDEIVRQESDNTDYQNQYSEFLKKNMIYEEEPTPKEDKPAKRKKKEPKKLEYFMA
jgi:DNA-directed RNA polymerase specialized sigma subunit|tara:strand:- start:531 stop:1088 length:558 start_codon:yes stop_codon:yes gene_type:complete